MDKSEVPFQLEDVVLQQQLKHALDNVYLKSFWWTADGKKHNSEAAKGHIYYGRFCTRELLWYHDVLLGQSQFGMEQSLLNDIDLIWQGQNDAGNLPRGYGAGGPNFHYDVEEFGRFDDRFQYDYAWIYNPIDNVPGLIITTLRAYQYTGDDAFLRCHYECLRKAFTFMDSVSRDYLYGMDWDAPDSVDWREQTHVDDPTGGQSTRLAEDVGINGCTTYNQALFYRSIVLLSEMERVLGHTTEAQYFEDYSAEVREHTNRDYRYGGLWDSDSGTYIGCRGRDDRPYFLYGSYRFEPMAQIWATYWGLPSDEQAKRIVSLFGRNFDRYVTPHGYVMVCDPPYQIWDGWYFGGYAAMAFAQYHYQEQAWQCLHRMAENFTRPNQPYEHESLAGRPMNECSCNVVPVINAMRVVKEGIFGIKVEADGLHVCPLLEGAGRYVLTYRGKQVTVVKKGSGFALRAVKLNGKAYRFEAQAGVILLPEDLQEENLLELWT